jgi:hypothetical protein
MASGVRCDASLHVCNVAPWKVTPSFAGELFPPETNNPQQLPGVDECSEKFGGKAG